MHPNVWPKATATEDLEPAFMALGRLISDIALQIARHCDAVVEDLYPGRRCTSLYETLSKSRAAKGRLLYYFPRSHTGVSKSEGRELWCGCHNDHGTITGLLPAKYYVPNGGPATRPPTDSFEGLHVLPSGADVPLRAHIPSDCLAFQIGESAQIVTGGALRATPHFVALPSSDSPVARVTFAVFLQPNPWDILRLPKGVDISEAFHTSPRVPPLAPRFQDGHSFGAFSAKTLGAGNVKCQVDSTKD